MEHGSGSGPGARRSPGRAPGELTPQRLWPAAAGAGRGRQALLAASEEDLAHELGSFGARGARVSALSDGPGGRAVGAGRSSAPGSRSSPPSTRSTRARSSRSPTPHSSSTRPETSSASRLPAVAVVGSRAASRYGRDVADAARREPLARPASRSSRASRAASTRPRTRRRSRAPGGTIAVLGCGLDVDYPRENARFEDGDFARRAPAPLRVPSGRRAAVRRISRFATASSRDSARASWSSKPRGGAGSLITARLAADFGRDVFAVPGSVFSETSAGTHELLRDGAILCRGAEDVLGGALSDDRDGPVAAVGAGGGPGRGSPFRRRAGLLETLCRDERRFGRRARRARRTCPRAVVLAALFELEAAGLAAEAGRTLRPGALG